MKDNERIITLAYINLATHADKTAKAVTTG